MSIYTVCQKITLPETYDERWLIIEWPDLDGARIVGVHNSQEAAVEEARRLLREGRRR